MSNPDHIKNMHRINRIMGQLKGVEKMIVEKKYCMDILQQTRAVSSAIKSLENNILNKGEGFRFHIYFVESTNIFLCWYSF